MQRLDALGGEAESLAEYLADQRGVVDAASKLVLRIEPRIAVDADN
jgi:hypothetical protein